MSDQTVNTIQQEHILVCLSSSPSNERIVRTAGRMVKAFGCDFTALYVQTLDRTALSKNDLARLTDHINQPFGRVASAQIGMKACRQTAAFLVKLC